jgi:hypothetical protein
MLLYLFLYLFAGAARTPFAGLPSLLRCKMTGSKAGLGRHERARWRIRFKTPADCQDRASQW